MSNPCFVCTGPGLHEFSASIQCPVCRFPARAVPLKAKPSSTPDAAIVLSFDGGGIKGLSSLFIEEELMKAVKRKEREVRFQARDPSQECGNEDRPGEDENEDNEEVRPGDYFTFIVGTSTGGIIATMQGIFGLKVSECISEYKKLGEEIFGRPRPFHARSLRWFPRSKYDSESYESVISNFVDRCNNKASAPFVRQRSWHYTAKFIKTRTKKVLKVVKPKEKTSELPALAESNKRFDRAKVKCKTVAVATKYDKSGESAFLFRNYDHERTSKHGDRDIKNRGKACKASVVEVIRATSAATGYFKEVTIPRNRIHLEVETPDIESTTHYRFLDGATSANNPSQTAWNEACAWQMGVSETDYSSVAEAIGCVVSIGCGKTKWQMFTNTKELPISKYFRLILTLAKVITDTKSTHRETRGLAREHQVPYFRFEVQNGLERMKLDEWKKKRRTIKDEDSGDKLTLRNGQKIRTFDYIKEMTQRYLDGRTSRGDDPEDPKMTIREEIEICATLLVQYKNERERYKQTQQNGAVEAAHPARNRNSEGSATQGTDNNDLAITTIPEGVRTA